MDKNAIKKYAVWARNELIARVSQKALLYGITPKNIVDAEADSIDGRLLTDTEKNQRKALIAQIKEKGFEQVMEEVAYTWFNRFSALRFMEVNGYLPSHVRVFTDEENNFKPQIITEAIHLEMDGLDMEKVYAFKDENKTEELYKYLLITQCNALNKILPGMFQRISDYTELLLPDNLLREGSVIEQMIVLISEDDWKEAVEIIGWLYQDYNSGPKDILINANKQYKREEIPFVTQIFTSDWIVKYIVDNSLGRYWIERNPKSELRNKLEFFVPTQNGEIEYKDEKISPETITFFDPCMGSGHILIYAFDVLMEIYKECGYSERDAVQSIIQNNLFGADIDCRAYQFAYFAIKMKSRSFDRGLFRNRNIEPNLVVVEESNEIKQTAFEGMTTNKEQDRIGEYLVKAYLNAKEIGTLSEIEDYDYKSYLAYLNSCQSQGQMTIEGGIWIANTLPVLKSLANQAIILKNKFTIVCTNPPYMPNNKMSKELKTFIEEVYKDYKGKTFDTFFAFIIRCIDYTKKDGYVGMLTPFVWMFISSYEKLRNYILNTTNVTTLVQLEYNAFEAACVPICAFVFEKGAKNKYGEYIKLSNFKGVDVQAPKTLEAIKNPNCNYKFYADQNSFKNIHGMPIAYWCGEKFIMSFKEGTPLGELAISRNGIKTGDNDRFLRLWWEVMSSKCNMSASNIDDAVNSRLKWFPYNKGGEARKWYGNDEYVIDWENNGLELIKNAKTDGRNVQNYPDHLKFQPSVSWSLITSSTPTFRFKQYNLSDIAGMTFFPQKKDLLYYLAFCNTPIALEMISLIAPTINLQSGDVGRLPIFVDSNKQKNVDLITNDNIILSKNDWDSFETSWGFKKSPLLNESSIQLAFETWKKQCEDDFYRLKANEEELNRIFIDIYGVKDEIASEVADKDITLKTNTAYRYKQKKKKSKDNEFEPEEEIVEAKELRDKKFLRDTVCEFISYAVGCMFGRYSLDVNGLAYAGGEWDDNKYITFTPDKDNIIPICDDEYFDDDITGRFIEFVKTVFGEETFQINLTFIAEALGNKSNPKEVIRSYFLNDLFKDHCNMYTSRGAGKRPIYWQFDSGKNNGFKCLIYMHRYQPDTIARIRTDYVHEQQSRYRTAIADLEQRINGASTSDRVKLNKQLTKLKDQDTELRGYEEKIHHLADQMIRIDLDNGVKNNYEIFKDVLAKIK